jgi:fatty-acyl-CoA synthase
MRGTMMDFPLTLPTILERARQIFSRVEIVSRKPDKTLERYTYGDFYRRARALSEALRSAGLKKGDRVATLMWNQSAHLEAYFGIPCAGGVLHTLNLRLPPDMLGFIAVHAGDRFLIVDQTLLPLLEKFRAQAHFERIFVVAPKGAPLQGEMENYETLLATATGDFAYPKLDEEDALGMCYTSGTTGRPKGVVYSHRAIVLHSLALSLVDSLCFGACDTLLPVVPQFHANAWGLPFAATMVGAKLVLPGPHLDAESLLDLFERERVTVAAGVPTIWLAILEALDKAPERFKLIPGMRMVVGGAAAPESLIRGFDRHGLRVLHAWGMTELSPLGTVAFVRPHLQSAPEDQKYQVRAKQGVPAPFVEIRAVGERGEVPWDGATPGELQVRGPWVAASYYQQTDDDKRWTDDGWFCTGDVVTIDADAYVKITDRTKDLIKSGGEWISSVDLENALMGHPAVREAAVVAVPHPKWGERPLAVVVLREGAGPTPEELKAFLAPRFPSWWLPGGFAFVDAIPRTSAGKFQKSALRETYRSWPWEPEP